MVSDSPAPRAPIGALAVSAPGPGSPLCEPPGLAGAPPRAGDLMSRRIPYGYLGLVVIGRQIALSYAETTALPNGLLTRGSDYPGILREVNTCCGRSSYGQSLFLSCTTWLLTRPAPRMSSRAPLTG